MNRENNSDTNLLNETNESGCFEGLKRILKKSEKVGGTF